MQKEAFLKYDCFVLKCVSDWQASVKSWFKYLDIFRYASRLSCFEFFFTKFKRVITFRFQQISCYFMNNFPITERL
jgi:hypothetical protein